MNYTYFGNRIERSPLGNMGLQLLEAQEKLVSQEYEVENLRIKAAMYKAYFFRNSILAEKLEKQSEEKQAEWINRLCRLTGISEDGAKEIAEEKLEYKWDQISMLEDRQAERYSVQREKLIRKLERSNPLRYIKNKEHAMAILEAGNRHTCTDYEKKLKVLHELEKEGFIEKGDAKEIARTQSMGDILNNINA